MELQKDAIVGTGVTAQTAAGDPKRHTPGRRAGPRARTNNTERKHTKKAPRSRQRQETHNAHWSGGNGAALPSPNLRGGNDSLLGRGGRLPVGSADPWRAPKCSPRSASTTRSIAPVHQNRVQLRLYACMHGGLAEISGHLWPWPGGYRELHRLAASNSQLQPCPVAQKLVTRGSRLMSRQVVVQQLTAFVH